MNILLISHIFPNPYANTIGIFVKNQLEILREYNVIEKVDVFIPVFTKEGRGLLEHELDKKTIYSLEEESFNLLYIRGTTWLNWPGLNVIIILFRIIRLVRKLRSEKRYDLIHAHFAYPDGVIAAILSKLFAIPMVMTCHGSDIFRFARRRWALVLVRMACRKAKRIFCVSNALATEVKLITTEKDKVIVTYNGINLSHFYPISIIDARKRLNLDERDIIILYVGNLIKSKGVMDLLESFLTIKESRKDVRLVFVGEGPARGEMQEFIVTHSLDGIICLSGPKEYEEIPVWMSASDLLVLPSKSEGFGIVLVEALASGKPVVGTDVGGIPEIINSPEVGIIVPPGDTDGLAAAILKAMEKPWDRDKLTQRAQEFSAERLAKILAEQYNYVGGK